MSFLKFLPFWTYFGHFLTLFWPLVIFGVKFLQIFIWTYINCVNMQKIALINSISMGIINFYHFFTYFGPFLTLFWPLVIFWVNFLQIVICAYINCVIMLKIALINGISMGIFNFYHFLPILDPFLTILTLFCPLVIFRIKF